MSRRKVAKVDPGQLSLFEPPSAPRPSRPAAQGELAMAIPRVTPPPPTPPAFRPTRTSDGSLRMPEALRLEANLVLLAGAGTGKTHSVVTLCLHVLAGLRSQRPAPVPPDALCLITFTEKAAAELRARLWRRVDALARGVGQEPELAQSAEALEKPLPDAEAWRRIREQLGGATVSTFHALCRELLAVAPGGAGGASTILDERSARALVLECAQQVVLEALEAHEPAAEALCRLVSFGGAERRPGLIDWLAAMLGRLREDGVSAGTQPVTEVKVARGEFEAAHASAIAAARQAASAYGPKYTDRAAAASALARGLALLTEDSFSEPQGFPALIAPFAGWKDQATLPLKAQLRSLEGLWGALRAAPHGTTVRELLTRLEVRHARALEQRAAIDFTGLLVRARDLLRDHPAVRAQIHQRFQVLLVDEMQDTNRLQLELVCLLAEERSRAPRSFSQDLAGSGDELTRLELEPAFLCAVGDRKQSIYEFRGADVTVAQQLLTRVEASGGGRAVLATSYRAVPALTAFFNQAFPVLLREEGRTATGFQPTASSRLPEANAWDVGYRPAEDDLHAIREARPGPAVVRLERPSQPMPELVADARALDADAIARYLSWLLAGNRQVLPRGAHEERPVRGGDVALLLRSFTHVETYRQALVRLGVRHRVVQGRGFFHAPEVMDCAAFLALVADPGDALALATVLRSPLVALSDAALLSLTVPGQGLKAAAVLQGRAPEELLSPPERAALGRLQACWAALRRERDRLGLRALLEALLDSFDARTRYAAAPFGEQALANLEKLLAVARTRETAGISLAAFASELRTLARVEAREAQGDLVDDADVEAVTVCTVHQSKGLEWPVVVLGELFSDPQRTPSDTVLFERHHGIALRAIDSDDLDIDSPRYVAVQQALTSRGKAEAKRLLYVAATRAAEHLVLGCMEFKRAGWAKAIEAMRVEWSKAQLEDLTTAVDVDALELPGQAEAAARPDPAEVTALFARVEALPRDTIREALLPVTQVQDLIACPRRYRYAWQLGLPEFARRASVAKDAGDEQDVRARGIAAHRLLELLPLEAADAGLEDRLRALAADQGLEASGPVIAAAARFRRTAFAAQLVRLGPGRVHRELPFALRLEDGEGFALLLRGQLDLLVEDEHGAGLVVDYKTTTRPAAGLAPYAFQLGCYALAARHFVKAGVPVRTGVSFLEEADPSPEWADGGAGLDGVALAKQARAFLRAPAGHDWPVLEQVRCQAMGCGYVWRCHGGNRL